MIVINFIAYVFLTAFLFNDNFRKNPHDLSKFRIYLLRIFIVLMLLLGIQVWIEIFIHQGPWQPLPGVAFSFRGALTVLAIPGFILPLKMIPLLLMQFSYKLIWLFMVGYPLWAANHSAAFSKLTKANLIGIVLDLLVIPWSYVFKNFILASKRNYQAFNPQRSRKRKDNG